MNLSLYENPIEQSFRIKLETRANAIVELKTKLKENPENAELKARIKQLSINLEDLIKEFYMTNPDNMFYGKFYKELPILTRKEKVTHQKTFEQEKLYLIKSSLRHGKRKAENQLNTDEME